MVAKKLLEIMKEIPYLQKDGEIKTKRGDISVLTEQKVLEMLRPQFIKYGLVMYPTDGRASVLSLADGALTTAEIQYVIVDTEDGDTIHTWGMGQGMDSRDKGAGMAMTYAGKYSILKSLLMITGDDPDVVSVESVFNPEKIYKSALDSLRALGDKKRITTAVVEIKGKQLDELLNKYKSQPSDENMQALINFEKAVRSLNV